MKDIRIRESPTVEIPEVENARRVCCRALELLDAPERHTPYNLLAALTATATELSVVAQRFDAVCAQRDVLRQEAEDRALALNLIAGDVDVGDDMADLAYLIAQLSSRSPGVVSMLKELGGELRNLLDTGTTP